MNPRNCAGLTWVEVVVALAIACVLVTLVAPILGGGCMVKGPATLTLSNLKQLHLATQAMAEDEVAANDASRGWPGDIEGTFTNWVRQLVPGYLSTNDFCKLSSAPGVQVPNGAIPSWEQVAFRVYAVRESSSTVTVLLSTANFTNTPHGGAPLSPNAKPYGNTDFVVFRKGGDGAILAARHVGQTNIIGDYAPLCR